MYYLYNTKFQVNINIIYIDIKFNIIIKNIYIIVEACSNYKLLSQSIAT